MLVVESNSSGRISVGAGLAGCCAFANNDLGNDIVALDKSSSAFLLIVDMVMGVIVSVVVVSMIVIMSMRMSAVAVAAEDKETDQVGE